MPKLFIELPQHVKNMTAEELIIYFPEGCNKSFLMRSIIMSEVNHGTINYERTLRSFWYSAVKPTLDKLGLLEESDQTEEGLTKWDATLSRYVADLLRRGYLTYNSLNIADTSRQKENPSNLYDVGNLTTYGNKVTIAPYSNIIIATEKDTVYNNIKKIAQLFGCSCISSKGQNSLGAMEMLIRGMRLKNNKTIYILTMTDYDPAGYYIANALRTQAKDILRALGKNNQVKIKRIGITPDQLSPEMVEANKYTPKQANRDKWFEQTGGINGEPKGLELDALEPTELREIFVNNIAEYIDLDIYSEFVKRSYIKMQILEGIEERIDEISEMVIDEFENELELKEFNILDLAKEGYSTIPIRNLCSNDLDSQIQICANRYIS